MGASLLSSPTLVECPFIVVTIGEYTFGAVNKSQTASRVGAQYSVTYPNYMESLNIVKIDGTVNTYVLKMIYQITAGSDPNLLEKVFSSIADTWRIKLSYGDLNSPTFIYKDEEALITKITSDVDASGSKITYSLTCTGDSLSLKGTKYDFPALSGKPSSIIKSLFSNAQYGLSNVFTGMTGQNSKYLSQLIAGDDKVVSIEAKNSIDVISYIAYLVNCMSPQKSNAANQILKGATYHLVIVDEKTNEYGGPYFKVVKVDNSITTIDAVNAYELDIGYPGKNMVTRFSINNDMQYSILYKSSEKVSQENYIYKINNEGNMSEIYSPSIARSPTLLRTTELDKTWWTKMTEFPITATVVIKGLLKPALLMSYVKLNVLFYGQKHISSGLYVITKQEDNISASGYQTTLTLLRTGGDA